MCLLSSYLVIIPDNVIHAPDRNLSVPVLYPHFLVFDNFLGDYPECKCLCCYVIYFIILKSLTKTKMSSMRHVQISMLWCYVIVLLLFDNSIHMGLAPNQECLCCCHSFFIILISVTQHTRICHPCARYMSHCCGVISSSSLLFYNFHTGINAISKVFVSLISFIFHFKIACKNTFLMSSMRHTYIPVLWCSVIVLLLFDNSCGGHARQIVFVLFM